MGPYDHSDVTTIMFLKDIIEVTDRVFESVVISKDG